MKTFDKITGGLHVAGVLVTIGVLLHVFYKQKESEELYKILSKNQDSLAVTIQKNADSMSACCDPIDSMYNGDHLGGIENKILSPRLRKHIDNEKKLRVENIKHYIHEYLRTSRIDTIHSYFQNRKINEYSIYSFLKKEGANKTQIGGILGMNFENTKEVDQVCQGVIDYCMEHHISVSTPITLGHGIEQYIQETIHYDFYTELESIYHNMQEVNSLYKEELKEIQYHRKKHPDVAAINEALKITNDYNFDLARHSLLILLGSLQDKNNTFVRGNIINASKAVLQYADSISDNEFIKQTKEMKIAIMPYDLNKTNFIQQVQILIKKLDSNDRDDWHQVIIHNSHTVTLLLHLSDQKYGCEQTDYTSISDILDNEMVGVCRHFAMIFKILYNAIAEKQGLQAEAITNIQPLELHTSNTVIYEDKNGAIQRVSFDPTVSSGDIIHYLRTKKHGSIKNKKRNEKKKYTFAGEIRAYNNLGIETGPTIDNQIHDITTS